MRIYRENNYIHIVDDDGTLLEGDAALVQVYAMTLEENRFYIRGQFRGQTKTWARVSLDDLNDKDGVPYSLEGWRAFYTENTGSFDKGWVGRLVHLEQTNGLYEIFELTEAGSGSLTLPQGATIQTARYLGGADALALQVDQESRPYDQPALDGGEEIITVALSSDGSYVLSGAPDGVIAIVYWVKVPLIYKENIPMDSILGGMDGYWVDAGASKDGRVRMYAGTDPKFLSSWVDDNTIKVVSDLLVAKTLDGLSSSITELNYMQGVTSGVQAQINSLASVANFTGSVATYADIATELPSPDDKDMVIVLTDETQGNQTTIYIYSESTAAWEYSGTFSVEVRDFSTEPLDLETEVTGVLPANRVHVDIARTSQLHTQGTDDRLADGTVDLVMATDLRTHLDDDGKHREINDAGVGATDLWSAQKINSIDSSLWEADGVTGIKPKDAKTVDASNIANLPDGLDDFDPPITTQETEPDDAATISAYFNTGWFKFTWAKLKEWLTVLFVTVNDLFLTNREFGVHDPEAMTVTDNGDRTVTIAGDLRATYEGKLISETVASFDTSWTSPAHAEADVDYYLTFNGTDIDWRTVFGFNTPIFAIKPKGCPFILREPHGRNMAKDTWRSLHFGIGTQLITGGIITNIVEDSFVVDERRPIVGETAVLDQDLKGVLPELATKSYTRMYLSSVSSNNFEEAQADIIEVGADNRPYYYDNSTGSYVKTLVPKVTTGAAAARARYLSVYLFGVPVAGGSSQPYRFILVQPQGFSTTLGGEIARSPANIDLGDMGVQSPEYVVFKQFIIRYDPSEGTGDWNHAQVVDIRGSQFAPLSVVNTGVQPSMESPIEPSFEPVAVGDRLQQVGEKLAGVQETIIADIELTSDTKEIDITGLAIPKGKGMRVTILGDTVDVNGADIVGRIFIQVNGVATAGSYYRWEWRSSSHHITSFRGIQLIRCFTEIMNAGIVTFNSEHQREDSIVIDHATGETNFSVNNIESLLIYNLEYFKTGTRILITWL